MNKARPLEKSIVEIRSILNREFMDILEGLFLVIQPRDLHGAFYLHLECRVDILHEVEHLRSCRFVMLPEFP